MTGFTTRVRAAVAAAGLLACASPLAAQTRHYRGRALRYEAVWLDRSQTVVRGPVRWYRGGATVPVVVVARTPWVPRRVLLAPRFYPPRRDVLFGPRARWVVRPRPVARPFAAWRRERWPI